MTKQAYDLEKRTFYLFIFNFPWPLLDPMIKKDNLLLTEIQHFTCIRPNNHASQLKYGINYVLNALSRKFRI